jgi:hypothetical protein
VGHELKIPRGDFAGTPQNVAREIMRVVSSERPNVALAYIGQLASELPNAQSTTQPSIAPQAPASIPSAVSPYRLPTPEQMARPSPRTLEEVEAARLKATAEQDVKDITDFRKSLSEKASTARERMFDANTMISLTDKSANIFGYFNKPSIANAVTKLVNAGGTVLGISFKLPAFKEALLLAGATEKEMQTLQEADFISIRQQLALASQMKGSVTEYERKLAEKAVANTEDNPNTARWKSNILKARALADREIWELYQSNPNLPETRFTALPAYKEIQNKLDKRLEVNNKAYAR